MQIAVAQDGPANAPHGLPLPKPARRRTTEQRRGAEVFGRWSEEHVGKFLRCGDYQILRSRARIGRAEVDLIAVRDDTVAFIEVKGRRNKWDGLDCVNKTKMRKMTRAANAWLSQNEAYAHCAIRFDIALVGADHSIEYLENAFESVESDDFEL